MTNSPASRSFPLLGLLSGIVALAVLVGALLLLDRAADANTGRALALPEELGGMTAVDLGEDPSAGIAAASFDYNDERFSEALDGAAAASRVYADDQGAAIRVLAYRADAGPLLPLTFQDPATSQSGYVEELEKHDDADCLLTRLTEMGAQMQSAQGDTGAEAGQVLGGQCQRTGGGLTVVLQIQEVEVDVAVELLDEVFTKVA